MELLKILAQKGELVNLTEKVIIVYVLRIDIHLHLKKLDQLYTYEFLSAQMIW